MFFPSVPRDDVGGRLRLERGCCDGVVRQEKELQLFQGGLGAGLLPAEGDRLVDPGGRVCDGSISPALIRACLAGTLQGWTEGTMEVFIELKASLKESRDQTGSVGITWT